MRHFGLLLDVLRVLVLLPQDRYTCPRIAAVWALLLGTYHAIFERSRRVERGGDSWVVVARTRIVVIPPAADWAVRAECWWMNRWWRPGRWPGLARALWRLGARRILREGR